jgi:hypothetical protein
METSPSERSWSEYPLIREMYPGSNGSTHGERNEAAPASMAAMSEISVTISPVSGPGS